MAYSLEFPDYPYDVVERFPMVAPVHQNLKQGAVVALSGGLDSTVALAWALSRYGTENVFPVLFAYGQRHIRELEHAHQVVRYYQMESQYEVIKLDRDIFRGAGSSLIDPDVELSQNSLGEYDELMQQHGGQPTVVPNRNMIFLAILGAIALKHKVNQIVMGVHAGDAHNAHYPDCSMDFISVMTTALSIATEGSVFIATPFVNGPKSQIVSQGHRLNAPMALTMSCYAGQKTACGQCGTCLERIHAFADAGMQDPIEYAIDINWEKLMKFGRAGDQSSKQQLPLI